MIELHKMGELEAADLLNKSLFPRRAGSDKTIAAELLKELTYLPLAITQAAACINSRHMPIAEYLGLLQGTEEDLIGLMSKEFVDETRRGGWKNAIAATWLVSFEQIYKNDRPAAELLCFMSCIEPESIP